MSRFLKMTATIAALSITAFCSADLINGTGFDVTELASFETPVVTFDNSNEDTRLENTEFSTLPSPAGLALFALAARGSRRRRD